MKYQVPIERLAEILEGSNLANEYLRSMQHVMIMSFGCKSLVHSFDICVYTGFNMS